MSNGIAAKLVWDGGDEVRIPEGRGVPREDQMQGTAAERLSELAGRICYDSLGRGRPSFTEEVVTGADPHTGEQLIKRIEGYHDHILAVGHGSVLEHFNFTVEISETGNPELVPPAVDLAHNLLNRPGIWAYCPCAEVLRITTNLRSIREFNSASFVPKCGGANAWRLGAALSQAASILAPHIIEQPLQDSQLDCRIVKPVLDEEKWVSLYMSMGRGASHEQVRHGDFTAISQRSTRYVDESESPWVEHPLITAFRSNSERHDLEGGYGITRECDQILRKIAETQDTAAACYQQICKHLEPWLISRSVDKATARKQARGAARGYLGNALQTEMIFSASVAQWRRMIRQRASVFADAEIREVYTHVLRELKACRYADSFADFELQPSPDGIGMVAVEK